MKYEKTVLFSMPFEQFEILIKECIRLEIQKVAIPTQKEDLLITRKESAKLLNISLVTLNDFCKRGIIVSYRIGTRVRFKKSEVLNSLKEVQSIKHMRKEVGQK